MPWLKRSDRWKEYDFFACNRLKNNKQCVTWIPCNANNGSIEIYVMNVATGMKWKICERTNKKSREETIADTLSLYVNDCNFSSNHALVPSLNSFLFFAVHDLFILGYKTIMAMITIPANVWVWVCVSNTYAFVGSLKRKLNNYLRFACSIVAVSDVHHSCSLFGHIERNTYIYLECDAKYHDDPLFFEHFC